MSRLGGSPSWCSWPSDIFCCQCPPWWEGWRSGHFSHLLKSYPVCDNAHSAHYDAACQDFACSTLLYTLQPQGKEVGLFSDVEYVLGPRKVVWNVYHQEFEAADHFNFFAADIEYVVHDLLKFTTIHFISLMLLKRSFTLLLSSGCLTSSLYAISSLLVIRTTTGGHQHSWQIRLFGCLAMQSCVSSSSLKQLEPWEAPVLMMVRWDISRGEDCLHNCCNGIWGWMVWSGCMWWISSLADVELFMCAMKSFSKYYYCKL